MIRDGYAGATTNRIAERAGVSVGSIYQYFDGKDAVFARLIDREVEAIMRIFDAGAAPPEDGLMRTLRRLLSVAVDAWSYGPQLYQRLEQVPDDALRNRVDEARTLLSGFIRSLLEKHRAELRVCDLDVATFVVINASTGLSTNATSEMYGEPLVDTTVELLERYLIA